MHYRVTHNGRYLFHIAAFSYADALAEARTIAARTMRPEVVNGLAVELDQ